MCKRLPALLGFVFFLHIALAQPLQIQDTFKVRGFHLDLRIQVMKMPALKQLAYTLSKQGINTLIMEWEGTYPFLEDPLIPNRYAYSRKEVKDFIHYCKGLHIDVIPLQQSFGHVEYILRHTRYSNLREDDKDFSQVCPSEPGLNRILFTRLFKDMAAMHPSPYFHIGGDETHLLGHCDKCKKRVEEIGISRLYFDHIKLLCDIVTSLGKRPVLWADIALKYPQYIHLLPRETIFVDWNYGWDLNSFGNHDQLIKSGYEIWGAPAIRSSPDNYYLTRWQYHFNNIRDFVPFCRKMGYQGIVMTSWSTSGQYAPSYESEDGLVDLAALRHVYPISGFDMLMAAYSKSIVLQDGLDISQFITGYCADKFGFNKNESLKFQKVIFSVPYTITDGKVDADSALSVRNLLDSVRSTAAILQTLHPKRNKTAFSHFQLMADIRVFYVNFIELENEINADTINQEKIPAYVRRLQSMINQEPALNKRFIALNQGLLYPAALEEENNLRNQKIQILYNRLARTK